MTRACAILVAVGALLAGCNRTVDDGVWTTTWRLDGRDVGDVSTAYGQTCGRGASGPHYLRHLRYSRRRACNTVCAAGDAACRLRCDGALQLVRAHCEPTTHREAVNWFPVR